MARRAGCAIRGTSSSDLVLRLASRRPPTLLGCRRNRSLLKPPRRPVADSRTEVELATARAVETAQTEIREVGCCLSADRLALPRGLGHIKRRRSQKLHPAAASRRLLDQVKVDRAERTGAGAGRFAGASVKGFGGAGVWSVRTRAVSETTRKAWGTPRGATATPRGRSG